MTFITRLAAAFTLGCALAAPAAAQDYPTKNITLIVPFAAGGPTDVISRIIGEHMSRTLGHQLIIENVRRRRRHHRLDPRQARRAGRLHHHHRPHGHACGLGRALSEAAIRPAHRFRADRSDRRHADPDSRQEGFSREGPQGVRRAREEERDDAQRRPCGRRLGVVHHLPAAQLDHGREADCRCRSTARARR